MSLRSTFTKYVAPVFVSLGMACATTSSNLENKVEQEVTLEEREKEVGEYWLDFASKLRALGECVVWETNKIDACMSKIPITVYETPGEEPVILRRIVYKNTDGKEGYELINILAAPESFPRYMDKKTFDVEINASIDVKNKRYLHSKTTQKLTDHNLPPKEDTKLVITCHNALGQQLPVKDGECVYNK